MLNYGSLRRWYYVASKTIADSLLRERERERERIDRAELFNQVSPLIKEGTVPLSIEQPREYKWRERE